MAGSNITLTKGANANGAPKQLIIASTGGGGLDCAECSGDDLAITGDLTVEGKDIILKYDASNYVTFTVESDGKLTVTPTSAAATARIRFNGVLRDTSNNRIESVNRGARSSQTRIGSEMF